ncbi:MAG: outer membrane lipoprotein-sorting protein [Betaproteobacteria bacterium TMED82]|nr:MAG: outer membrane lipoprotein-sorting protein [Betaproteobacteria bacterium TMED82]|tara:strand:+ start:7956 stop:9275 length:1320 start_codon:yes stop_codon:yes gene_type:complete
MLIRDFAPLFSALVLFTVGGGVFADVTYSGAEKSGNESIGIPAWTGGLTRPPLGWQKSQGYVNPFAEEKPLFIINASNFIEFKDKLTDGQIALLEKIPAFKMPVYKSHRTAVLPKEIIKIIEQESGNARIVSHGIIGRSESSIPFPQPKNGEEAINNYLMRYIGNGFEREYSWFPVRPGKKYYRVGFKDRVVVAQSMRPPQIKRGLNYAFYANFSAPSTLVGTVYLVHEFTNLIENPRAAWIYNAGARRVRRAPDLAYDNVADGTEGMRTTDQYFGFNGATDRYTWVLKGKRSLFVPYNTYDISSKKLKYEEILDNGTVNADLMRYELHRVWVVEATLKEKSNHIYGKRVFYLDEDSWSLLGEDCYDTRGNIWRIGIHGFIQIYDKLVPWPNILIWHDLSNGNYLVSHLDNEIRKPIRFGINDRWSNFQPDALRRRGTR